MNRLELYIYQLVKHNPRIKDLVRDQYQRILSLVPVPKEKVKYRVVEREGFFYGFHDKNPWSFDHLHLLAHGFNNLQNKMPGVDDRVDIGFFTGDDFTLFKKITTTSCFNWQQGSMLQWIGQTGLFVFNDAGGEDNIAKIYNLEGKPVGVLPKAIAAVDRDGNKALSYNFARLQRHFPGYGYMHGIDPELNTESPSLHGISIIDIKKNQVVKLFSVKDIAAFHKEKTMNGAMHFLTHCLFSPSGQRFIFLHRWIKNENVTYTRMLSCDVNGHRLHLFPTRDMVSHIAWQDESNVLAYCRSRENQDAYVLFKDLSDEFRIIGKKEFSSDGHPSFPMTNRDWFVTDTYPDRFRRSFLILFNIPQEKRFDLGYFRQPLQFKDAVRCDLHPRWNHNGTMICFDSAHPGKRSLCTMNIRDAISSDTILTY